MPAVVRRPHAAVADAGSMPLTTKRFAAEASVMASQQTSLVPFGDEVTARKLTPAPLGLSPGGDLKAQAEASATGR